MMLYKCRMFVFEDFIGGWQVLISMYHCASRDQSLEVKLFLELKGRCCATVYTLQSSVPKFPRVIVRIFCSDQEEVWCILLVLVSTRILGSNVVPLILVISESNVIYRYKRQARSFLRDKSDDVWVSISSSRWRSLCLWRLVMKLFLNFNSTLYFLINLTRSLSQRLLMWSMVKGFCSRTEKDIPDTC